MLFFLAPKKLSSMSDFFLSTSDLTHNAINVSVLPHFSFSLLRANSMNLNILHSVCELNILPIKINYFDDNGNSGRNISVLYKQINKKNTQKSVDKQFSCLFFLLLDFLF